MFIYTFIHQKHVFPKPFVRNDPCHLGDRRKSCLLVINALILIRYL